MVRFARLVSCVVFGFMAAGSAAQAQTPAAPAAASQDAERFWAAFDFGATFGHKSSGFYGGEGGYKLTPLLGIYVEGGHMGNVGTEALDERAQKIANAVGGTSSASYEINYFDVGVRYTPVMQLSVHPYIMGGFGLAHVRAETTISINGQPVPPESLGIQFGNDLNGTTNKGLFVIGGGVTYPFKTRYFVDGSFRYGRVFAKTSEIEGDTGINTQRLSVGIGVKF